LELLSKILPDQYSYHLTKAEQTASKSWSRPIRTVSWSQVYNTSYSPKQNHAAESKSQQILSNHGNSIIRDSTLVY